MAGLGNVLPSISKLGNGGHGVLDLIFRDGALIMSDSQLLAGLGGVGDLGLSIPLPIIGFSFENPTELNLLKYSYTEYPMLNKTMVTNSFIKENGEVKLRGLRPITRGNNILVNYAANKGLVILIEKYADAGGLWTLNTYWGTYGNLALESLDGVVTEAGGGTAFDFTFKRINFDTVAKPKGVAGIVSKLFS